MAGQAGNSPNLIISPHVISGTFVGAEPPAQVVKEDPKKAPVVAPLPPAPTQTNVTKKSYASIDMKEGPPTPQVAKTTPVAKQKPAPKPVSKAAEGPEKSSAKPTQAKESSDGIVSQNNSSFNEQGYSIFIENLPFSANIETVEEEFKRFGTIKPRGVQVRHNKRNRFVFGFVEYETQQSMQAAIEASPIHMEEKEVRIEAKTSNSRGVRFQSGRGVCHGDNFRARVGSYMDNANYRGSDNFNCRNEGEGYNRRDEGEFYNHRNECVSPLVSRSDGDNNIRRSDGDNNSHRNEGENFNHRNDGDNYNRRKHGGENFSCRNNFRNQNDFFGRGRGPPPPGNGYHQNGHGLHPS